MSGKFFNEADVAEISAFKHFMCKCFRFSRWFAATGFVAGGIAAIVFINYIPPAGTLAGRLYLIHYETWVNGAGLLSEIAERLGIGGIAEFLHAPAIALIFYVGIPGIIVAGFMFLIGVIIHFTLDCGRKLFRRLTTVQT